MQLIVGVGQDEVEVLKQYGQGKNSLLPRKWPTDTLLRSLITQQERQNKINIFRGGTYSSNAITEWLPRVSG